MVTTRFEWQACCRAARQRPSVTRYEPRRNLVQNLPTVRCLRAAWLKRCGAHVKAADSAFEVAGRRASGEAPPMAPRSGGSLASSLTDRGVLDEWFCRRAAAVSRAPPPARSARTA